MSAGDAGAGSSAGFSTRLEGQKAEHPTLIILQAVGVFSLILQLGLAARMFETSSYPFVSTTIVADLLASVVGAVGRALPVAPLTAVQLAAFLVVMIPALVFEVARHASGRPVSRSTRLMRIAVWCMPFMTCTAIYGRAVHYCMFLQVERPTHLISCFY